MTQNNADFSETMQLPSPKSDGDRSLEACLKLRRSVREFSQRSMSVDILSQLLWSIQGITGPADHKRTPPSAGGLHPLEVYAVVGKVDTVAPGIYKYFPLNHTMGRHLAGDLRNDLGRAALNQTWLADASVSFLLAAVYQRTIQKYGERGYRYVHMDAGFAAENLHLQTVALGMGTVVIGAFDDQAVHQLVQLPAEEQPMLIMPVGWSSGR
ncbi:MAG: SagB/ThcOx family dehydrogenase [Candidatus Promineifilaceae bacterium]